MIVFLAKCVGVFVAAFVAVNVVHVAIRMPVMYLLYRKANPKLTTPLAAFLNERDRMPAIPVDVAETQLAIPAQNQCVSRRCSGRGEDGAAGAKGA